MAITKGVTRKVSIPHEEGSWLDLAQLSYRQLAEARRAKLDDTLGLLRAMKDLTLPQPDATQQADALNAYDIGVLLRHGIAAWSYGAEVTADDLDERTAQWAAREILAFSLPDETALGKAPSRSIAISEDPVPLRRSG